MDQQVPYTMVAKSLVAASASLMRTFANRPIGVGRRVLQVKEPLGPSTAGGKLSRQVLALVQGSSSVPIGWLDVVNAECALKEYPMIKLAHELRGGAALDFTADDYAAFSALLTAELVSLEVKVRIEVVDASELLTEKTMRPVGRGRQVDPMVLVLGVVVLALLGVAGVLLFQRA
ncbi:MAG: hypothetical protein MUC96_08795 [Myxococcaceae bacterium]|jgi:hypothetical protein|nr:hypothetical protein [Myxococcaceae bacterium]